jgi:hypothetical protein
MGRSKGKKKKNRKSRSYWIETAKYEKRKVESSRQVRATSVDSTGEQNKMSYKRVGESESQCLLSQPASNRPR